MTETAPATPPPSAGPEIVSARQPASPRLIYIGLAVAAGLGLLIAGLLAGGDEPRSPTGSDRLAIAVQPAPKPAPLAIAKSSDPLNALPEEAASLPANPQPRATPAPAPQITPASTEPASRPGRANPAFDCEAANSRAEQMICDDERLAAADRRMDRLYQQALDAGVPQRILRRQQRAFLDAREAAARDGADALADVYSERSAELEGMAQGY